jgi:hypothetical protein
MPTIKPKQLFLIDGLGALLTAFLLGTVLTTFQSLFGMPINVLFLLAAIAVVYAVYSFFNHFRMQKNWKVYMKIIAIANFAYCLLTIGLMIFFCQELTTLGFAYFIIEAFIILSLATLEFRNSLSWKNSDLN